MLGDVVQLANNLWVVIGDMPADIPNALVYRRGDRLYLMDSGAGPTMRASILNVLYALGPAQSFTLLNSHGHADHVGNNDLIHLTQAKERHHYLSGAGLSLLDAHSYFAAQFSKLSQYYDPVSGFQTHRLRWRAVGVLRDVAKVFAGEQRTLEIFFRLYLRKFKPLRPSLETLQTYESLPRQPLVVGSAPWTGWVLGKMRCGFSKRAAIRQTKCCFTCRSTSCFTRLTSPFRSFRPFRARTAW